MIYPRAVVGGVAGGVTACYLIASGPIGHGILAASVIGLYGFAIFAKPVMTVVRNTPKTITTKTPTHTVTATAYRPKLNIRYIAA